MDLYETQQTACYNCGLDPINVLLIFILFVRLVDLLIQLRPDRFDVVFDA